MNRAWKRLVELAAITLAGVAVVAAGPAKAADEEVKHVLLISVDGLHALDLANYIRANPKSNFAKIVDHGVNFTAASSARPSDSFPGLLALVTGGSPNVTGVWYDDSYDRSLSPPSVADGTGPSLCPNTVGTEVLFDETAELDLTKLNGGGGLDPTHMPRDPNNNCAPVYPHDFLRVNTIFEVAKAAGLRTAWCDKHLAYDLVNGPSGNGVDDLCQLEIAANGDYTSSTAQAEKYDDLKVKILVHQMEGKDSTGHKAPVPAIFGGNFQEISVGQKQKTGGYADAMGTPSVELQGALDHMDHILGQLRDGLEDNGLDGSTVIVLGTKHGQSPIDVAKRVGIKASVITDELNSKTANLITENGGNYINGGAAYTPGLWMGDDSLLIWEQTQTHTDELVKILLDNQPTPANSFTIGNGVEQVFSGHSLMLRFNNPTVDPRTPDIVAETIQGVIFTGGKKLAEHGGFHEDNTHVALVVAKKGWDHVTFKPAVTNYQVAPTILKLLGLNPHDLQAVNREHVQMLPSVPGTGL
jgi:Type I phosphodiesterase / nucleotide pyrophosphatase